MNFFELGDYAVFCEYAKTRNGFKHVAKVFYKHRFEGEVKTCYLNRTWERYTYQSVLWKAAKMVNVDFDKDWDALAEKQAY